MCPCPSVFSDKGDTTAGSGEFKYEWLFSGGFRAGLHTARVPEHRAEEGRQRRPSHHTQPGGVPKGELYTVL